MTTGEQIRQARELLKMSQTELAQALQCSRFQLSRWEAGSQLPSTRFLLRLATLLDISVDKLLRGE